MGRAVGGAKDSSLSFKDSTTKKKREKSATREKSGHILYGIMDLKKIVT